MEYRVGDGYLEAIFPDGRRAYLGDVDVACEVMAGFLAERDYGG